MLLTATHGHPKKITKKQKIITNFKDNLTSQKPGKTRTILESRLILEGWQIKVSKWSKTVKKTYFSTKICTKEHLNPERFTEIPTVFAGTAREFQTEKLRNYSFFTRKSSKPKLLQTPQITQLRKNTLTYIC